MQSALMRGIYRVAQKVNHYQIIIKKLYYIVLKLANEIRMYVRLKYQSSTIVVSVGNKYSVRALLCDVFNNAWPAK